MAGMPNMNNLMQMAQKMQRDLARINDDLKERMVEGTAGDGAVSVIANGAQEIQAIRIAPVAVDPDDVETLEDLLIVAVNQALEAARELHKTETEKVTGGVSMPGLF